MNAEIETEAAQFPEKEYINGIFVAVHQPSNLATIIIYVILQRHWFSKKVSIINRVGLRKISNLLH
jgi:hypothetical protein